MAGDLDPLARKADADLIVERAAAQLRDILQASVRAIDPFPPYPGSFFSYGIEVDPPPNFGADLGCVVVGQDGELYELLMGVDLTADPSDPIGMREEEMRKLDLAPSAYVSLAHAAVDAVTRYMLEREGGRGYSRT